MTAALTIDTGQATAAAADLAGAPARVAATLQPTRLAATVDVLGQAVKGAWSGPYGSALAAGTRVETNPTMAVVTGGSAGHLSGGATAGDLVLGVEFGGGRRVGQVSAGRRTAAHARRTTRQFKGQTLTMDRALDGAADHAGDLLADDLEQAVTS